MNREQFFIKAEGLFGPPDIMRIQDAYVFAKEFHRGQKPRDSGERYFNHPRRAASILMDYPPVSVEEVILGLLHDVVEDRHVPERLMRSAFGARIARDAQLLSKFAVSYGPHGLLIKTEKDKESYYGGIARGSSNVRRAKCADRQDNMSDMGGWPPERKKKYILETRVHILPIAYLTDIRMAETLDRLCREAEAGLYLP